MHKMIRCKMQIVFTKKKDFSILICLQIKQMDLGHVWTRTQWQIKLLLMRTLTLNATMDLCSVQEFNITMIL